jgi:Holliday junction DNA helicase RuvA
VIGSLRGTLIDRGAGEVLVEVGGVGYSVVVAPTTAVALGAIGDEVFVWTHHHVREDVDTLYGFATRDEKATFVALIGAHGVGPAMALAILSVHGPGSLARVLVDDDVAALCLVPGVGKKTAARLLIELKSRLDVPIGEPIPAGVAAGNGHGRTSLPSPHADVREALAGLGYGPDEVHVATSDLPDEGDAATLLRLALARLAQGA